MINKNLAALAFCTAMNSVQAAEGFSNEEVAQEVAACGATALAAELHKLPLGADVGYDSAFHALHRVASSVIGPEATQTAMLGRSRVYDLAAQTLPSEKVLGLIQYDIGACKMWFGYAARKEAQKPVRPKTEQRGIPSCGSPTGPEVSI